jgi:predicted Zn-dependent peptidase
MLQLFKRVPSKLSTIAVAFDAGSRAEGTKYSSGIAHMLEHMIFKGTDKRDYVAIARDIAFLGGSTNAFTSNEMVYFYITVPFENIETAVEILQDVVFNSTFPEEEFQKEREVVREEELSSRDHVSSMMWDAFSSNFLSGELSNPIIGTQDSISEFTRDEIVSFHEEFYGRDNVIVSLCGDHTEEVGQALLSKYFGESDGSVSHKVPFYDEDYKESREVYITKPALEHTYVWMGYPGLKIASEHEAAIAIMTAIFGSGMDSRLFTEVREEKGLAYGIGSTMDSFRDQGVYLIYSSTRAENVEETIKTIEVEVEKIKTELVTDEELQRAKNKYRADTYKLTESSSSFARWDIGRRFFGQEGLDSLSEEVNSLTAENIRDAANLVFDESRRLTLYCSNEEEGEE